MKNKIIPLGSLDKVLAFTDDQILISRNEHESIESLQADAKRKIVPMSSVKELFYINPNGYFFIEHDVNGKTKREPVLLQDTTTMESLLESIAEVKNFSKGERTQSAKNGVIINGIIALFVAFLFWTLYGIAVDAQNGGHAEAYGRRKGLKKILIDITEAIGPTGVWVIGALLMLYFVYKIVKSAKPSKGVSYK